MALSDAAAGAKMPQLSVPGNCGLAHGSVTQIQASQESYDGGRAFVTMASAAADAAAVCRAEGSESIRVAVLEPRCSHRQTQWPTLLFVSGLFSGHLPLFLQLQLQLLSLSLLLSWWRRLLLVVVVVAVIFS